MISDYKNKRNQTIIFRDESWNKLELGRNAIISMLRFVQDEKSKCEAGGVLLGRFIVDSENVVVDCLTVPHSSDKRSRFHFFRDAEAHQKIISDIWFQSEGKCNYLGEWHSHPEPDPSPSSNDLEDWQRKLQSDTYDNNCLYFVIVGTKQINAWRGAREGACLEKLIQL